MIAKFCSSCGREGAPDKYYCVECGGFLVPKGKVGDLESSVSHPKFTTHEPPTVKKEITFTTPFMRFIKFFFLLSVLVLLVLIVLAALEPETLPPPAAPPIATAPFLVSQALLLARNGSSAGLTEQVINSYLRFKGAGTIKPPIDNMPMPKWQSSRAVLTEGQVACYLELNILNHPVFCSEVFHLSGTRFHWKLEPLFGSIGRIPFSGRFLALLTPLLEFYATPVNLELAQIAASGTVIIHPGMVAFGRQ